jgi:N-acetyl-alpha-D-muramate 1-phosphate uridylyltransferase
MRPLTDSTPKPLLTVQGQTLLEHQIKFLSQFVSKIGITVGYMSEEVEKCANQYGIDLVINSEGRGNAFWINSPTIRSISTPIVVITCDNLMEIDYEALQSESDRNQDQSFLMTRQATLKVAGDRVLEENGRVIKISHRSDTNLLATGLQVLNTGQLNPLRVYDDFHEVWADLIDQKKLFICSTHPFSWSAIDTPADLEKANKT